MPIPERKTLWNPHNVLWLDLDVDTFCCLGTNRYGKQCRWEITNKRCDAASAELDALSVTKPSEVLKQKNTLSSIAKYLLCDDYHQNQAIEVREGWLSKIDDYMAVFEEQEELRTKAARMEKEIKELRRQSDLDRSLIQEQDTDMHPQLELLRQDHEALEQRYQRNVSDSWGHIVEIQQLKADLSRSRNDLGQTVKALDEAEDVKGSLKSQLSTVHTHLGQAQRESASLRKQETMASQEMTNAESNLKGAQEELTHLRKQVAEAEVAKMSLSEQITTAQAKLKKAQAEADSLRVQVTEKNRALAAQDASRIRVVAQLQDGIDHLTVRLSETWLNVFYREVALFVKQNRCNKMGNEMTKLSSQVEELAEQKKGMQTELIAAKQSHEHFKKQALKAGAFLAVVTTLQIIGRHGGTP